MGKIIRGWLGNERAVEEWVDLRDFNKPEFYRGLFRELILTDAGKVLGRLIVLNYEDSQIGIASDRDQLAKAEDFMKRSLTSRRNARRRWSRSWVR